MPTGAFGMLPSEPVLFSAIWMRRSISRTLSRYSVTRLRSFAPRPFCKRGTAAVTASRMLSSSSMRARRSGTVPPSPNRRSNTTRGLISIGSGVVGVRHEIVFM